MVNMEKFTLLSIFFINTVAVQIVNTSAQISGNDTSIDTNSTLASCHVPAHSNVSHIRIQQTVDEIMIEGRCYLACAENVSNSFVV